ncbi:MAG: cupin domain-containing protein [Firmicutes bacterium]|nr:cupin domain-containing protein [Bacillota bacterium]
MSVPGDVIRKIRRSKKMTMQELSDSVGVSKSLISQVERGEVLPSLTTLEKIAAVLDMPITDFFEVESDEINEEDIIVRRDHRKKIIMPGSPVVYNLLTKSLKNKIEFLLIEVPPNVYKETVDTTFKHRGEEYFIVLEGQLHLTIDDKQFVLNEGDSGCFNSGIAHAFENKTDKKTVFLVAVTESFIGS